jgi:hypothetical protein
MKRKRRRETERGNTQLNLPFLLSLFSHKRHPHQSTQASATTNYVYVASSDPLASTQFVEIGP